jgi:hypothetical protein
LGEECPPVTASVLAAVGPLAAVAVVALIVTLLGFALVVVLSAKTNMSVRISKLVEIRRGAVDPRKVSSSTLNYAASIHRTRAPARGRYNRGPSNPHRYRGTCVAASLS